MMTKINGVYESLLPLYFLSKCLALNPIRFNKCKYKFEIDKHSFTYSFIFSVITIFSFLYLTENFKANNKKFKNSTILKTTFWFDLYSSMFIQIISTLFSCLNARSHVMILNEVLTIDKSLKQLGCEISHKNSFYLCCAIILVILAEVVAVGFSDYVLYQDSSQTKMFLIVSSLTIITNRLVELQYGSLVYLVYVRLRETNNTLKIMCEDVLATETGKTNFQENIDPRNGNISSTTTVNRIHCIHNCLCKLCHYINWMYGFQIMAIVGSAFNVTLSELYNCYNVIKTAKELYIWDLYASIQWIMILQTQIFMVVIFCRYTTQEVHKTIYILNRLQNLCNNENLSISLKLFSLHELHKKVTFSVCGLFPLDNRTLLMIYSTITTCLVILVQYDIAKSSNLAILNEQPKNE